MVRWFSRKGAKETPSSTPSTDASEGPMSLDMALGGFGAVVDDFGKQSTLATDPRQNLPNNGTWGGRRDDLDNHSSSSSSGSVETADFLPDDDQSIDTASSADSRKPLFDESLYYADADDATVQTDDPDAEGWQQRKANDLLKDLTMSSPRKTIPSTALESFVSPLATPRIIDDEGNAQAVEEDYESDQDDDDSQVEDDDIDDSYNDNDENNVDGSNDNISPACSPGRQRQTELDECNDGSDFDGGDDHDDDRSLTGSRRSISEEDNSNGSYDHQGGDSPMSPREACDEQEEGFDDRSRHSSEYSDDAKDYSSDDADNDVDADGFGRSQHQHQQHANDNSPACSPERQRQTDLGDCNDGSDFDDGDEDLSSYVGSQRSNKGDNSCGSYDQGDSPESPEEDYDEQQEAYDDDESRHSSDFSDDANDYSGEGDHDADVDRSVHSHTQQQQQQQHVNDNSPAFSPQRQKHTELDNYDDGSDFEDGEEDRSSSGSCRSGEGDNSHGSYDQGDSPKSQGEDYDEQAAAYDDESRHSSDYSGDAKDYSSDAENDVADRSGHSQLLHTDSSPNNPTMNDSQHKPDPNTQQGQLETNEFAEGLVAAAAPQKDGVRADDLTAHFSSVPVDIEHNDDAKSTGSKWLGFRKKPSSAISVNESNPSMIDSQRKIDSDMPQGDEVAAKAVDGVAPAATQGDGEKADNLAAYFSSVPGDIEGNNDAKSTGSKWFGFRKKPSSAISVNESNPSKPDSQHQDDSDMSKDQDDAVKAVEGVAPAATHGDGEQADNLAANHSNVSVDNEDNNNVKSTGIKWFGFRKNTSSASSLNSPTKTDSQRQIDSDIPSQDDAGKTVERVSAVALQTVSESEDDQTAPLGSRLLENSRSSSSPEERIDESIPKLTADGSCSVFPQQHANNNSPACSPQRQRQTELDECTDGSDIDGDRPYTGSQRSSDAENSNGSYDQEGRDSPRSPREDCDEQESFDDRSRHSSEYSDDAKDYSNDGDNDVDADGSGRSQQQQQQQQQHANVSSPACSPERQRQTELDECDDGSDFDGDEDDDRSSTGSQRSCEGENSNGSYDQGGDSPMSPREACDEQEEGFDDRSRHSSEYSDDAKDYSSDDGDNDVDDDGQQQQHANDNDNDNSPAFSPERQKQTELDECDDGSDFDGDDDNDRSYAGSQRSSNEGDNSCDSHDQDDHDEQKEAHDDESHHSSGFPDDASGEGDHDAVVDRRGHSHTQQQHVNYNSPAFSPQRQKHTELDNYDDGSDFEDGEEDRSSSGSRRSGEGDNSHGSYDQGDSAKSQGEDYDEQAAAYDDESRHSSDYSGDAKDYSSDGENDVVDRSGHSQQHNTNDSSPVGFPRQQRQTELDQYDDGSSFDDDNKIRSNTGPRRSLSSPNEGFDDEEAYQDSPDSTPFEDFNEGEGSSVVSGSATPEDFQSPYADTDQKRLGESELKVTSIVMEDHGFPGDNAFGASSFGEFDEGVHSSSVSDDPPAKFSQRSDDFLVHSDSASPEELPFSSTSFGDFDEGEGFPVVPKVSTSEHSESFYSPGSKENVENHEATIPIIREVNREENDHPSVDDCPTRKPDNASVGVQTISSASARTKCLAIARQLLEADSENVVGEHAVEDSDESASSDVDREEAVPIGYAEEGHSRNTDGSLEEKQSPALSHLRSAQKFLEGDFDDSSSRISDSETVSSSKNARNKHLAIARQLLEGDFEDVADEDGADALFPATGVREEPNNVSSSATGEVAGPEENNNVERPVSEVESDDEGSSSGSGSDEGSDEGSGSDDDTDGYNLVVKEAPLLRLENVTALTRAKGAIDPNAQKKGSGGKGWGKWLGFGKKEPEKQIGSNSMHNLSNAGADMQNDSQPKPFAEIRIGEAKTAAPSDGKDAKQERPKDLNDEPAGVPVTVIAGEPTSSAKQEDNSTNPKLPPAKAFLMPVHTPDVPKNGVGTVESILSNESISELVQATHPTDKLSKMPGLVAQTSVNHEKAQRKPEPSAPPAMAEAISISPPSTKPQTAPSPAPTTTPELVLGSHKKVVKSPAKPPMSPSLQSAPNSPVKQPDSPTKGGKKKKKKSKDKNDLTTHLEKRVRKVNRHGDEVSVGTMNINRTMAPNVVMGFDDFEDKSQNKRPWKKTLSKRKSPMNLDDGPPTIDGLVSEEELLAVVEALQTIPESETTTGAMDVSTHSKESETDPSSENMLALSDFCDENKKEDNGSLLLAKDRDDELMSLVSFNELESKFSADKETINEANFDEMWDDVSCDGSTALEYEVKKREKDRAKEKKKTHRAKAKEEKKAKATPRLRLFEKGKAKKNKVKKKRESKLSDEFLTAIQRVFDDDDILDGEGSASDQEESIVEIPEGALSRSISDKSLFYTEDKSVSNASKSSKTREDDSRAGGVTDDDDGKSRGSDQSSAASRSKRRKSNSQEDGSLSRGSRKSKSSRRSRRSNRSRQPDVDPAAIFEAELKRQQGSKVLSISSLRQEMTDRRGTSVRLLEKEFSDRKRQKSGDNPKQPKLAQIDFNTATAGKLGVQEFNFSSEAEDFFASRTNETPGLFASGKDSDKETRTTDAGGSLAGGLGKHLSRWNADASVTELDDLKTIMIRAEKEDTPSVTGMMGGMANAIAELSPHLPNLATIQNASNMPKMPNLPGMPTASPARSVKSKLPTTDPLAMPMSPAGFSFNPGFNDMPLTTITEGGGGTAWDDENETGLLFSTGWDDGGGGGTGGGDTGGRERALPTKSQSTSSRFNLGSVKGLDLKKVKGFMPKLPSVRRTQSGPSGMQMFGDDDRGLLG